MPFRRLPLLLLAAFAASIATGLATCSGPGGLGEEAPPPKLADLSALPDLTRPVSFERDVKPVLENRCVVCHACYDAPCQLLFSSPEGIVRGASKQAVYDTTRLREADPTRLGVDAHTPAEWRAKGFFSVLGGMHDGSATPGSMTRVNPALAQETLLWKMLALGAANPFPPGEKLPADVGLDIERPLTCARADELDAYAAKNPHGGMPYGMAALSPDELRTLAAWLVQGAPFDTKPFVVPAGAGAQVAKWEAFLNGTGTKQRVVARYLYEHWFVAHLTFADHPAGPFFKVVRSRTPAGEPIDEIATRRPYDDPGPTFFYRLQPVTSTIVSKTHITYELSPQRMARLTKLFLGKDWQATKLPPYTPDVSSNPFVVFEEIPPRARYQYLLDDAHYFVDTFIRGPVCRGQVAVDVIEDQFWISFLDPDHDLSVTNPKFLAETKDLLALPSADAGWLEYNRLQRKYLNERERFYEQIDPKELGPALGWIWDGDGTNRNALLTVFRNFDNATVVKGFVGATPKTAWVMDYPIFERIYYDLVAGYDVYGSVAHQIATRLYMDHLRMQSENSFLAFLPADQREAIRASWYVGATRQLTYFLVDQMQSEGHGTQVRYTPGGDAKAELLDQILGRTPKVAGPPDLLNRCASPPCDRPGATPVERGVERELQQLASVTGPWVAPLPEVSLLRVRTGGGASGDLAYALVHNVAHTNVAFMFGEDGRLIPADDTVSVVRGEFGSYPNFAFEIEAGDAAAFVAALRGVTTDEGFSQVAQRFGVRRTDPRIWSGSDWLTVEGMREDPTTAGRLDLDRYVNP